jgi:hypothetical protein
MWFAIVVPIKARITNTIISKGFYIIEDLGGRMVTFFVSGMKALHIISHCSLSFREHGIIVIRYTPYQEGSL